MSHALALAVALGVGVSSAFGGYVVGAVGFQPFKLQCEVNVK